MKEYKVYQTIWTIVEAENEMEAVDQVREDESIYEGWTKCEVEDINKTPADIVDFYPTLNGGRINENK